MPLLFEFKRIFTNTDALADDLNGKPFNIKAFKYGKSGVHKLVANWNIFLEDIREENNEKNSYLDSYKWKAKKEFGKESG